MDDSELMRELSVESNVSFRFREFRICSATGDSVATVISELGREWCAIREEGGALYDVYQDSRAPGVILLKSSENVVATALLQLDHPVFTINWQDSCLRLQPSPPNEVKIHRAFSLVDDGKQIGRIERPSWWSWKSIITLLDPVPRVITLFCFCLSYFLWQTIGGGNPWAYGPPKKRPPGY